MSFHTCRSKRTSRRACVRLFLMISVGLLPSAWLGATAPAWWSARGVLTPGATVDNYAAVNIGQLKAIAAKAADEFDAEFAGMGGAGPEITALIASWRAEPGGGVTRDNYLAVNHGQLKAVAKPFYARLIALHIVGQYPWTGTADNYASANIGQVKFLFSFLADTNGNGIPDSWELNNIGSLVTDPLADSDGDGLSNRAEFLANAKPNQAAQVVTSSTALDLQVFTP